MGRPYKSELDAMECTYEYIDSLDISNLYGFFKYIIIFLSVLFFSYLLTACTSSHKEYTLTQHKSKSQAMFYTITDQKGHLIIIDGGHKRDAKSVSEVIEKNGGRVDAWILTHPHPDHISAFNEIYAAGTVDIGTIYTIPTDYDIYNERKQSWDKFEVYEKYVDLTKDADNIVYLHEDDELDLYGLKMEVFHSFDKEQLADAWDPCNDGSLIFKLSTDNTSVLFLSDVGPGWSDYILQKYGERLSADYVQMGHHGNGGMPWEFYEKIAPQTAFFDIPEKWITGEKESDAKEKWDSMQNSGIQTFHYGTAPNTVILE